MSPRMIPEGRVLLIPKVPTVGDLNNAVDITDYVTSDGVQFEHELDPVIEAFRTGYEHSVELTSGNLRELAKAMNAHVYQKAKRVERAMHYPTSTPPWARRKR